MGPIVFIIRQQFQSIRPLRQQIRSKFQYLGKYGSK